MKYFILLILFPILFVGCATSYTPISGLQSIGDAEMSNEDIKVTLGIQPLGDNGRFKDTQEENKITILKLTVENLSDSTFFVDSKNIYLKGIPDGEPISQLSPHEVADRMALASGTYWLWGLLWMGYYQNDNGDVSSCWLPIGLPIALINFFKARGTNQDFEDEITNNAFPNGEISSKEVKSGMLFFNRAGGVKYELVINYSDDMGNKKQITLPYKI